MLYYSLQRKIEIIMESHQSEKVVLLSLHTDFLLFRLNKPNRMHLYPKSLTNNYTMRSKT